MFADLAGFTTMAEGRDPEAVKELLDACFGALVPVIDAHGGVVDKIIGDELMAVFGAPVAHEDDAERAVRAGVNLIEALGRLDPSLEMRVGINTGEVLAGPVGPGGAHTVTGDTVNTAHRLVGVAAKGTVLVAERTFAATQDAIVYGPPTAHALRGRTEPVVTYAAQSARYAPGEHPGPARPNPLVGRRQELQRLVDAVEDAAASHTPRVVTVLGEAGLGKSRLIDELAPTLARHGSRARVVGVHCAPYGSQGPLAPLADVVAALLHAHDHASAAHRTSVIAESVESLAPLVEADRGHLLERVLQLLALAPTPAAPSVDVAPGRSRLSDELITAARLVIEASAVRAPLVVVLDDAQFADDVVLDLVERVEIWAGRRPLVLVTVGREELAQHRPALATPVQGRPVVVRLEPLDDDASRSLLERTLTEVDGHVGHLAPADETQLLQAAGGNPLLLDQLARYLRESEALVPVDGGWRATRPLAEAGLPDGARSLLSARLDALPAAERTFLQGASIVGRTFEAADLEAMGLDVDDELLVRLWRRGLLLVGATDGEVAFRHAMVRDAAYASVALGDRAAQHARLGHWLAEQGGPASEARITHHYERAVSLGRELGHLDPEVAAAAGHHLVAAGRAAQGRDAARDAAHWYERARALELLDAADAVDVCLLHGATLLALRRYSEATSAFEEVLTRTDDLRAIGEANTGLGVAARLQGDIATADARFAAGVAAWRGAGDRVGEAGAIRTHGWAELVVGRPGPARPKLLQARELEEAAGSPLGTT
ncbi:MAG: adenylate/guanylate cyclase domain-containing protein, partial [Acidimicrobiales bacterium]